MLNILFYIPIFYLAINVFGILVEKIKIPRIYAALFWGVIVSNSAQVLDLVASDFASSLSQIGMFSLLFLLGYGLDMQKLKQQSKLILKITLYVILSESAVGTLILHFIFHINWVLAGVIAISFATVGEIALLPLLKEFKILNTKLGQTIMGVAIIDDVFEILAFILLLVVIKGVNYTDIFYETMPLIAILLGLLFKNMTKPSLKLSKSINFLALYIFGPIFFFTAGTEANINILLNKFFVILAFTLVIKATKMLSAYIASYKQLGTKKSLVLGTGLGIKFSTSIIMLIILLEKNLIAEELFSILIGIKILFKFIVPIVLSFLLNRWRSELVEPTTSRQKY